jgi:uncharacterized protein (DUF58 family)
VSRGRPGRLAWARLNHVLLPDGSRPLATEPSTPGARALWLLFELYDVLTPEGRVLLLVTLAVAGASLDVARTDAHVLFCVLGGLLGAAWAASSVHRSHGVTLEVNVARRVTAGDALAFSLEIRNDGARPCSGLVVRGPRLPWDGRWEGAAPGGMRIEPGAVAHMEVRARFTRRGEHRLRPFEVAEVIPLGFARGRPVRSRDVRFLVVPRIANVLRLTTPVGRRHQPGGVTLASKTGESMDLLGVRPYRPGDLVRDLHARSWARTGVPVVREFQEEYFSRVGVVVDTDGAVADDRVLEAALSLAAGVVAHLSRGEALIDLLVIGDAVHKLTLGRSLGFLEQALDLLAVVEPGRTPDPDALVRGLTPHLPRLSCVVIVAVAWDDSRRLLRDRIALAGVACTTLLVGTGGATPGDVTEVSPDAVSRGEALTL